MPYRSTVLAGVCTALLAAALGAAGEPAWTDAEREDFLQRAEIGTAEKLEIGVTGSKRATLSLNGWSHDAHIQAVDEVKHKVKVGRRTVLDFRDSYRYNIAAYRLDRLLDLNMVPVSVERKVDGDPAAVTWWVDDVMLMERERIANDVKPPHPRSWREQSYRKRVFTQLIANEDLNRGNILITGDWKVWLVDFTRAFRRNKKPTDPDKLVKIETSLLERLRGLSREVLESRLGDVLIEAELKPLLARRDAIVKHFDREIERRGAAEVLYQAGEDTP